MDSPIYGVYDITFAKNTMVEAEILNEFKSLKNKLLLEKNRKESYKDVKKI